MAKKDLKKGVFITFEGPEGCGKTTQSRLLAEGLIAQGYFVVPTREPGGTKLGERIRAILLDRHEMAIADRAELLLFEASRAQIVRDVIAPALEKGAVVICDRFSDATKAYQGYGAGQDLAMIGRLDRVATGGLTPDLTILLDIPAAQGLRRATKGGTDRMEGKGRPYHERVRRGYLALARGDKARVKVIAVRKTIGRTQRLVAREAERVIQRYTRAG